MVRFEWDLGFVLGTEGELEGVKEVVGDMPEYSVNVFLTRIASRTS